MITDYEFNNYLTSQNVDEVVQRIRNILGEPDTFFSVAWMPAGLGVPSLYTHQQIESHRLNDFVRQGSGGFTIHCPGVLQFGATVTHNDVPSALRDANAGKEHTFVKITGGNGRKDLLQQEIVLRGLNQYGVAWYTVVKVEDYSTQERAESQAKTLEQVADLLARRGVDASVVSMLRQDAEQVRYTWESPFDQK